MQPAKKWSQELEGLRGLASLWVVLGHICILTRFQIPILSDPAIGVDLFILLSGNDSNLLIVFYVQIMPDDFVMQLHRF